MASEYGPFIVNTKLMEENKTDDDPFAHEYFRQNMVGTGPYKVSEISPNDKTVLEKFDEYHGGWEGSYFDKIVVRIVPENGTRRQLIETGEADAATRNLTAEDYEALKSNSDVQVLTYPSTAVMWAIMNVPRLKTVDGRKGMSYAFPYDDVVNSVYTGMLKRSGPIASSVTGADPNVFLYQTDLAKAKELILAAGFAEGDTFDYVFEGSVTEDATVAQLFQANLSQIGFNLDLQPWDTSQMNDMVYGDSPAEERPVFVGGWSWWPDYNDTWNQLAPNFLKSATGGGGSNGGYWVNDRFEELMAKAEKSPDQNEINTLMIEAQNILTEQDPPVIYFGESVWASALRHDIQGFVPNPLYLSSYNFRGMYRE
jgi:peptide/nickel transport system substrate-binding protein